MKKLCILLVIFIVASSCSCKKEFPRDNALNYNVFCFYYNWYGNKEFDNKLIHWAHSVIHPSNHSTDNTYISGENNDIASNFFPQLGTYSNTDPQLIEKHMKMIADARIGVLSVTWWNESDMGAENIPFIMEKAAERGIKVCFHIEPFPGRNAQTVRDNIEQIIQLYGDHPAFFRLNGKPMFFIYDSYLIPAREWADLLSEQGNITIRNTSLDAIMIGLWVKEGEEAYFKESHFDGIYTYFASTGFTYGSTPENWKYMQKWAGENGKLFIPSVGPGYIDTRIRPWNNATTRNREDGKYYGRMFLKAIESGAKYISITSFNEWHEGTQIEPASPMESENFHYLDYDNLSNDYYLKRTAYWINYFENSNK